MGRHNSKARRPVLVTDPDAPAAGRLLRWWWLIPPVALALWPVAPIQAVVSTMALFVLGIGLRTIAPLVLGPRHGRVGVPERALPTWREAERSAGIIRKAWPALGAMADPADVRPTLERALYRLAVLLLRRAELDRALNDLRGATMGLPLDAPLRAEIAARAEEVTARSTELSEQIAARVGAIRRLAEVCGEHAFLAHRAERARGALRRAELAAAGDPEPAGEESVAQLAERTTAVLAAYRELSALPPISQLPQPGAAAG
ncbi:hypothetical protein [Dactylosporangium sp. NPDC048998]|uniref:hypothetical protein n=1 Tax=Dactylosporangium sp. NPDC048998 TaxID=3363976 RepID=UPI003720D4B6